MKRVKNRWKKKQVGRIMRKMLFFVPVEDMHIENDGEFGFPLILLKPKYVKWLIKYRNIHKYYAPLFENKDFKKAIEKRSKKRCHG